MTWQTSFGFTGLFTRKDIHFPRVRFQFKTRSELEDLSRGDRTAYFEDMLAALYSRRDELDEKARDHLARVITDCVQFGHAWKRPPATATTLTPISAPPKADGVNDAAERA